MFGERVFVSAPALVDEIGRLAAAAMVANFGDRLDEMMPEAGAVVTTETGTAVATEASAAGTTVVNDDLLQQLVSVDGQDVDLAELSRGGFSPAMLLPAVSSRMGFSPGVVAAVLGADSMADPLLPTTWVGGLLDDGVGCRRVLGPS